jgi:hypothetical protein
MEAQIAFLGAVFGFQPTDVPPLELPGIDAWRSRRAAATPASRV